MPSWDTLCKFQHSKLLILVVVISCLMLSCVNPVPYVPEATIVEQVGLPVTQQRLRTVLLRAVAPPIKVVELGDEFLRYYWHPSAGTQIFLGNVGRVEVFENRSVIIYGAAGQVLGSVVCATLEDAKMLADIMISLRGYHYRHRLAFSRTTDRPGPRATRVARAQEVLTSLGFYTGVVDGTMNDATQEAIRLYQTSQHLPATGALDTATRAKLGVR